MNRLLVLIFVFFPATAFAEVMDKEPSAWEVLAWGAIGGALAYLAARYRPWLLLLVLPLPLFFLFGVASELRDPFVGPAIIAEAGPSYVFFFSAAVIFIAVALLLGFVLRRLARARP